MPPWSQWPGEGRAGAVGILGNWYSCKKGIDIKQTRSKAGCQGKPWLMYQIILSNIGLPGSEGISCYPISETEDIKKKKMKK